MLLASALLSTWIIDTASVSAAQQDRPGIFLQGASVPRAKGLALDAALIRGWKVALSEPSFVVFETKLDQPASIGPPNALVPDQTLLRIRADFVQTPAGVNAYLYAEEVWYAGSPKEWIDNVTPQYRENLNNALSSLQSQWSEIAKTTTRANPGSSRPSNRSDNQPGAASAKVRVAPMLPARATATDRDPPKQPTPSLPARPKTPVMVDIEVGTWAYYAEQFAISRGCELSEIGAELISGNSADELHLVHCQDGSSLRVRCDREGCAGGR